MNWKSVNDAVSSFRMETTNTLHALCYDETGKLKQQNECRALIINNLILEEGMDIDAAENLADKTLRESGFWPVPQFDFDETEEEKPPAA